MGVEARLGMASVICSPMRIALIVLAAISFAGNCSAARLLDETYTGFFFGVVDNLGSNPPPNNAPPGVQISDPMRAWLTFRTESLDLEDYSFGTFFSNCWTPGGVPTLMHATEWLTFRIPGGTL